MTVDMKRQPERLAKAIKAYIKDIYPVPAEADESHVLTEMIADIFQWIGDWRIARKTAEQAEQAYQARMLGVIAEQYGKFKMPITAPLPYTPNWQRTEAHIDAIGGRWRRFKEPHDFIDFFFKLRRDGWYPRVFFNLHESSSMGRLAIHVSVDAPGNYPEAPHVKQSHDAEVGYIERGPKRLLGIMQELAERAEIEPPPPRELETPEGRQLRHIDIQEKHDSESSGT